MSLVNRRCLQMTAGMQGRSAAAVLVPGSSFGRLAKAVVLCGQRFGGARLSPDALERDWPSHPALWRGSGFARFQSSAPGRWIYGHAKLSKLEHVAKIGAPDDAGIRRAIAFEEYEFHPRTFSVPPVIEACRASGLIVFKAVSGGPEMSFQAVLPVLAELAMAGITHGDFAPWNVLKGTKPVVLDWEEWSTGYLPLVDLFSFLYKPAVLLGTMDARAFLRSLGASSGPVESFGRATGLDVAGWREDLRAFVEATQLASTRVNPGAFRRELLQMLG